MLLCTTQSEKNCKIIKARSKEHNNAKNKRLNLLKSSKTLIKNLKYPIVQSANEFRKKIVEVFLFYKTEESP